MSDIKFIYMLLFLLSIAVIGHTVDASSENNHAYDEQVVEGVRVVQVPREKMKQYCGMSNACYKVQHNTIYIRIIKTVEDYQLLNSLLKRVTRWNT